MEKELYKLRNDGDERQRRVEERATKISTVEENIGSLQNLKETKEAHLENLKVNTENLSVLMDEARANVSSKRREYEECRNKICELRKNSESKLALYGERMPHLIKAINDQASRFSKLPIGPLGTEIRLKPNVSKTGAAVIERELKDALGSFIVNSYEDKRLLDSIQERLRTNFNVVTAKFIENRYNISRGRCSHPEFPALYDVLDVKNPTVMNCLGMHCIHFLFVLLYT